MRKIRKTLSKLNRTLFPRRFKESHELAYWRERKKQEGDLHNVHYISFYTDYFGLSLSDYAGKRILDIGCGPRGSLEWADMASERVGLDPLADEYLKLGADRHRMRYVKSGSESIPFPSGHFDFVCSFNSLDHVDDLERTVREIGRVVRPGGLFLLLTDVNHEPTPCEPLTLRWDVVDLFRRDFDCLEQKQLERECNNIYNSALAGIEYDHVRLEKRYGILSAKFRRKGKTPLA